MNVVDKDMEAIQKDANQMQELFMNLLNNSIMVIVPTMEHTRLECINPKYITDVELVKEHESLLERLHEQIKISLDKVKNG
jgi:hypothetical protein